MSAPLNGDLQSNIIIGARINTGLSICEIPIEILRLKCRFFSLVLPLSASLFAQGPLQDALSAVESGDYSRAEQLLSENPEHLLLKGILQFHRGEYPAAEASLKQALENKEDPRGRTFLALAQAAIGGMQGRAQRTGAAVPPATSQRLASSGWAGLVPVPPG